MTNQQTTTTDAQSGTLVFKDQAGDYYLLPQEVLQQGRVPAEHTAALEAEIATMPAAAAGEDVQGHAAMLVGFILGGATVLAGYGMGWQMRNRNLLENAIAEGLAEGYAAGSS